MSKRSYQHVKAQKAGKEVDSYMCFTCNVVSPQNHGHHIVLYSEDGDASIDNMITLCPHCHAEYHAGRLQIDIGRF